MRGAATLLNFRKLVVEMLQRSHQYFPVARIVSGFEIVNDTGAGQKQAFPFFHSLRFHGTEGCSAACGSTGFRRLDLGFH